MSIHRLLVAKVVSETQDAHSIEFEVPAELADKFTYKPGQFLTLRVPSDETGSVARCYSLCSAPHDEGPLRVAVKRTADGYASNWLCDNATPGMEIDVLVPAGIFTPKSLDVDMLLFAGGSGVTPILSILRSVLETGSGSVTLIYANRDAQSVIFASALAELTRRYPDRLVVVHWLESVQGLPSAANLAALAAPYASREVFVCGPGPFMDAVSEAMTSLGKGRREVHIEKFRSLPRNPFEVEAAQEEAEEKAAIAEAEDMPVDDAPAPTDDGGTVTVELDGTTTELAWPAEKKLLDVMLEAGLEAPYSCREGACSACACRIVEGAVELAHNEVLDQEDLDDGLILACQSMRRTPSVHITYE
ncbi:ferredoxin--NADP reductase [Tsukamurella ocularis]|uniref:ferredoxin--NADP reductase n=1 Tax=Tsukamurella ocularis TaxID=1970234 RepID=UPI00216705B9|nr:ferredoxin--NADP reductase [Tsukamurella ocularis]MCS3778934.1 3-ketosteroid 9alpha-monooxygenase subunit B [Tsukamurella ocularis]MCS3787446.1 3-ketosteroid 9alpha-monooxygenase subunit B [Tsukamurella ocularis]MCS3851617.1 3-ketosteroid 9alpha-monooxygenase subunit B [Tsukamurella ocularis]